MPTSPTLFSDPTDKPYLMVLPNPSKTEKTLANAITALGKAQISRKDGAPLKNFELLDFRNRLDNVERVIKDIEKSFANDPNLTITTDHYKQLQATIFDFLLSPDLETFKKQLASLTYSETTLQHLRYFPTLSNLLYGALIGAVLGLFLGVTLTTGLAPLAALSALATGSELALQGAGIGAGVGTLYGAFMGATIPGLFFENERIVTTEHSLNDHWTMSSLPRRTEAFYEDASTAWSLK